MKFTERLKSQSDEYWKKHFAVLYDEHAKYIEKLEAERDALRGALKKLADAIREPNRPLYTANYLGLLVNEADALREKGGEEG